MINHFIKYFGVLAKTRRTIQELWNVTSSILKLLTIVVKNRLRFGHSFGLYQALYLIPKLSIQYSISFHLSRLENFNAVDLWLRDQNNQNNQSNGNSCVDQKECWVLEGGASECCTEEMLRLQKKWREVSPIWSGSWEQTVFMTGCWSEVFITNLKWKLRTDSIYDWLLEWGVII